jgi:hypothetical protein
MLLLPTRKVQSLNVQEARGIAWRISLRTAQVLQQQVFSQNCKSVLQVPDALKELLGPDAPDVSIEAVGFHYCQSWLHKVEMTLLMETDPSEILNEIIYCTRKVWAG